MTVERGLVSRRKLHAPSLAAALPYADRRRPVIGSLAVLSFPPYTKETVGESGCTFRHIFDSAYISI
ncbi:MAG: hypothetical protein K0Q94_1036 [Paenibacillus sp.]|jgi:hypothetical protein|uniref:hypothetical protein n=1 Tax=Paenibacillus sp. GCM10012303 TaxID=3317340 RepID=UPI0029F2E49C|nr:hypothetical protein [Paenibacillus sp.]